MVANLFSVKYDPLFIIIDIKLQGFINYNKKKENKKTIREDLYDVSLFFYKLCKIF